MPLLCVFDKDHWRSMSAAWSQTKGLCVGGCVSSDCLCITVGVRSLPSWTEPNDASSLMNFWNKPKNEHCAIYQQMLPCVVKYLCVCTQHGWAMGPHPTAQALKGEFTDCSASRDTCTHPACCEESPSRSPSTSWMKTTTDRLEYDTEENKNGKLLVHKWITFCFFLAFISVHAGESWQLELWHFPLW